MASFQLATLIDLAQRLERDDGISEIELRQRDAALRHQLRPTRPAPRLVAWLRALPPADSPTAGERTERHVGDVRRAAALLGLLLGGGAGASILHYDGSHPVNVVLALAGLVVVPTLLLAGLLLAVAMTRGRRPPQVLSARILLAAITRLLPPPVRNSLQRLDQPSLSDTGLRVTRFVALQTSQIFATMFHLGSLAALLFVVATSDVAFSWSTTFELDDRTAHSAVSVVASPWAGWLPGAVPSEELVRTSRYFRLGEGSFPADETRQPSRLGGWWAFLALSIVTYGLLPRMLISSILSVMLARGIRAIIPGLPGARAALLRLDGASIATSSGAGSTEPAPPEETKARPVPPRPVGTVITWARPVPEPGDLLPMLEESLELATDHIQHAGIANPDDDQKIFRTAVAASGDVVILVRGWEPPMLELLDRLTELRDALEPDRTIRVLAVAASGPGDSCPESQLQVWRGRLTGQLGPLVQVESLGRGEP